MRRSGRESARSSGGSNTPPSSTHFSTVVTPCQDTPCTRESARKVSGLARRLRACCCVRALTGHFADIRANESGELTQALVGDKPSTTLSVTSPGVGTAGARGDENGALEDGGSGGMGEPIGDTDISSSTTVRSLGSLAAVETRVANTMEALIPILDATNLQELRSAVQSSLRKCLPNVERSEVFLKNSTSQQIESDRTTLPLCGVIRDAFHQQTRQLCSIPHDSDPVLSLLGLQSADTHKILLVPVVSRRRNSNVGIIVASLKSESLSIAEEKCLELLMKQVSVAYEAVRHTQNESLKDNSHLESLIGLCGELHDQDAAALELKVIKYLREQTCSESGFLLLVVPETLELISQVVGSTILPEEVRFPGLWSCFAQALETKQPMFLEDIPPDRRGEVERIVETKVHTFLCVPVARKGSDNLIALACLVNKANGQRFGESDIQIVRQCFKYTATVLTSTLAFQNERKLKNQTQALLHVARKLFTRLGELPKMQTRQPRVLSNTGNLISVTRFANNFRIKHPIVEDLQAHPPPHSHSCTPFSRLNLLGSQHNNNHCKLGMDRRQESEGEALATTASAEAILSHSTTFIQEGQMSCSSQLFESFESSWHHQKQAVSSVESSQTSTSEASGQIDKQQAGKAGVPVEPTVSSSSLEDQTDSPEFPASEEVEECESEWLRNKKMSRHVSHALFYLFDPVNVDMEETFLDSFCESELSGSSHCDLPSNSSESDQVDEEDSVDPTRTGTKLCIPVRKAGVVTTTNMLRRMDTTTVDAAADCDAWTRNRDTRGQEQGNQIANMPDFSAMDIKQEDTVDDPDVLYVNSPSDLVTAPMKGPSFQHGLGNSKHVASTGPSLDSLASIHDTDATHVRKFKSRKIATVKFASMDSTDRDTRPRRQSLPEMSPTSLKRRKRSTRFMKASRLAGILKKFSEVRNLPSSHFPHLNGSEFNCLELLRSLQSVDAHYSDGDFLYDLTKLLREIMQEARNLTDAERCSVFLLDQDSDELVATVFDGITTNNKEVQAEIRLPKTQGIAGHVATTGTLLNIKDAYSHPLFYRGIDDSTGFRTRNILCFPIKDEEGVVLGVAQLCNKKTGTYFTTFDEDIASAFAIYCCISISHSLMYKKVIDIQYRNSLANELMMFHMKCLMYKKLQDTQHRNKLANELMMFHMQQIPMEEVHALAVMKIPNIGVFHPDFDKFKFPPRSLSEASTPQACQAMFEDLGFIQRYRLKSDTLARFLLMVKKGYRNPPYHNWMHAFAVAHFGYLCIKNLKLIEYLDDIELLALFVSCLCHDIDHRGTTNSFQVKSQSVLAALYSSEGSVMERHHLAQSMCILNTEGSNIFENLTSREYQQVLDLMREIILATDVAHHLRIFNSLQEMADKGYDKNDPKCHNLLLCLLMTAADLSDQTKSWKNTKHIAVLIYQEFFSQGDLEKALGESPLEMMDRERACVPDLQISFLDNIAIPVYRTLAKVFPAATPVAERVEDNRRHWVRKGQLLKLHQNSTQTMSVQEIIALGEEEEVDEEEEEKMDTSQQNGR